ncbi:MAG: hypothetical protein M3R36_08510 [Bacteroidota bacterium]|nr:hypothetical protein [Bacteroidota bacterium]
MINRKNRDVKFIIYQSLYIFVIAVLALKGANLDLTEVVKKDPDNIEKENYTDSLKIMIDSLLARGIVPELKYDTSQKYSDPGEFQKKLAEKQKEIATLRMEINSSPSFSVNQTSPNLQPPQQVEKEKAAEQKKQQEETEESKEKKEGLDFRVPQSFKQFTSNSVSNPSDQTIEIYGSDGSLLASVPPKGSRTFTIGNQSSLTFKNGGTSKTVPTIENAKPKIIIQRLVPAGEDVTVRSLQATVGYRVTLVDDNPGQLDVKFSGPVSVKQVGALVYDVTLDILRSKTAFENFAESRESPYTVTFQINVKDKIATQHSISQSGAFQFGEW